MARPQGSTWASPPRPRSSTWSERPEAPDGGEARVAPADGVGWRRLLAGALLRHARLQRSQSKAAAAPLLARLQPPARASSSATRVALSPAPPVAAHTRL